jgi:hypothetical protein
MNARDRRSLNIGLIIAIPCGVIGLLLCVYILGSAIIGREQNRGDTAAVTVTAVTAKADAAPADAAPAVAAWPVVAASAAPPARTYPAPTTRFNGMTADHWGRIALDADVGRVIDSLIPLERLGAEGIPYLLAAIDSHAATGRIDHLTRLLGVVSGRLVEPADLDRFVSFLSERYAAYDGTWMDVRGRAFRVLKDAGPKAAPLATRLRQLAEGRDSAGHAKMLLQSLGAR